MFHQIILENLTINRLNDIKTSKVIDCVYMLENSSKQSDANQFTKIFLN